MRIYGMPLSVLRTSPRSLLKALRSGHFVAIVNQRTQEIVAVVMSVRDFQTLTGQEKPLTWESRIWN